jgi:hypothetical protein
VERARRGKQEFSVFIGMTADIGRDYRLVKMVLNPIPPPVNRPRFYVPRTRTVDAAPVVPGAFQYYKFARDIETMSFGMGPEEDEDYDIEAMGYGMYFEEDEDFW